MSVAVIAGILGSVATIIGAAMYFFKTVSADVTKTTEQSDSDIDKQEQDNKNESESTGNPV